MKLIFNIKDIILKITYKNYEVEGLHFDCKS